MPPAKRKAARKDAEPPAEDVEDLKAKLAAMEERLRELEGERPSGFAARSAEETDASFEGERRQAPPPAFKPKRASAQDAADRPHRGTGYAALGQPPAETMQFRPAPPRSAGSPLWPQRPAYGTSASPGGPGASPSTPAGTRAPATAKPPRDAESLLGGTWLAIAGVVVLVLGVVFFLRLAFERGWIGYAERVMLGIAGGILIAALGDILHSRRRYGEYPQILTAGGAIIVYFSLYASWAFPLIRADIGMTRDVASLLMAFWAVAFVGYAVWRNAQWLAAVAVALGLVAALFSHELPGFSVSYVVLLGIAVAGAATWREWEPVAIGAPVASYLTLFLLLPFDVDPLTVMWGGVVLGGVALALGASRAWQTVAAAAVLALGVLLASVTMLDVAPGLTALVATSAAAAAAGTAVWRRWPLVAVAAIFVAAGLQHLAFVMDATDEALMALGGGLLAGSILTAFLLRYPRQGVTGEPQGIAVVAAAGFFLSWTLFLLVSDRQAWDAWEGPVTGILALFALALAFIPTPTEQARAGWASAGIFLALLWPPMQFDGATITIAWATLLLAASVIALVRPTRWLQLAMFAAAALFMLRYVFVDAPEMYRDDLSTTVGLIAMLAGVVGLGAAWQAELRHRGPEDASTRIHLALMLLVPVVYFAVALTGWSISIAWSAEALLILIAGLAMGSKDLRLGALALFGVVLGRVFLYDLTELALEVRIITFLAVGALLLLASFLFARRAGAEAETRSAPQGPTPPSSGAAGGPPGPNPPRAAVTFRPRQR